MCKASRVAFPCDESAGVTLRCAIGSAVCGGDDAGRRGPGVRELEHGARAALVEEALPIAEDERVDQQDELVDELLGQELPDDEDRPSFISDFGSRGRFGRLRPAASILGGPSLETNS
jgi:hypothetical protein